MNLNRRKVVLISFLAGVIVPFFVEIAGRCVGALGVHPGMWWSTVVICIWPTSVALIETSNDWRGYVAFIITALVNGLLYALIAFVVGYCISALKSSHEDG